MSIDQNPPDARSGRPVETPDGVSPLENGAATDLPPDSEILEGRVRTENRLLRARIAALERELAASRTENQQLIDRYEALLAERQSRNADSALSSRATAILTRVRHWLSRRR